VWANGTDKTSLKLRHEIGIDIIAWECDYPPWRTYLLHARMLRAMALLAPPGQSVQQTATAVGFDSLSAFTRAFAQFCGETPSTYRQRTNDVVAG
jgi:AraC-like DNA-binding protein